MWLPSTNITDNFVGCISTSLVIQMWQCRTKQTADGLAVPLHVWLSIMPDILLTLIKA